MAVTKALTKAIPYSKSSKVQEWDLEYTYENDSEGDATYYTSTFNTHVDATDADGAYVWRIIKRAHLELQGPIGINRGRCHIVDDSLE